MRTSCTSPSDRDHEEQSRKKKNETINNLDDRTYKNEKYLAKNKAVSLSASVLLKINAAYERFLEITQQQDGSRSR
jgi:hypothetical protein